MNKKEIRSYIFEIRSTDNGSGTSTISGNPIVYNSPTDIGGWFQEVIERGALDEADLTDVPLLVNHNAKMIPVARSRNNTPNSTLRLGVTVNGLEFDADLDTGNNMTARELNSAVVRQDISGMSFGFRVAEERWENLETDYPTRHITKFEKIVEISAVTFPAYEDTSIQSRAKETLESAKFALDSAKEERDEDALDSADKESLESEEEKRQLELEKAKFYFAQKEGESK